MIVITTKRCCKERLIAGNTSLERDSRCQERYEDCFSWACNIFCVICNDVIADAWLEAKSRVGICCGCAITNGDLLLELVEKAMLSNQRNSN
jgi:hypothetical protein